MVQNMQNDVKEVLEWQKSVLCRIRSLMPPLEDDGVAVVMDFVPETIAAVNAETFHMFAEVSVLKLTRLLE